VYAREFGNTQPYQHISEDSLVRRLDATEEDYRVADDYYEYEIRTHQVNISLANIGGVDLFDAFLTLDFPHVDGLGISEYIRLAPGSEKEHLVGYPTVETGERKIRVQSTIESVPRGSTVQAFSQPLRISVREPVAGLTLAVDYALRATSLSEPVIGTLRLHVSNS